MKKKFIQNVKKILVFFLTVCCMLGLIGCSNKENQTDSATNMIEDSQDSEKEDVVTVKEWGEQEIRSMFYQTQDANWSIIECVVVSDYAYDRVGAVLFWNSENETSNIAFFDADGYYQTCGVYAKTYDEPELTYLGNGVVTFKLEAEDGVVYNYNIAIAIDDNNVKFTVEDDL